MESFETERKDFNNKVIKIISESSLNKRKMEESQRRLSELTAKYNQAL
jgi:hypothetical protein